MIIVLLTPLPLVEVVYLLLRVVPAFFMLESRGRCQDLCAIEPLVLPFLLGRGERLASRGGQQVQEHSRVTLHEGMH